MENHGTQYETRFKLLRERMLAMKALWTEDEAAYHGEMVNFDSVWSYPKPIQTPHPPIILGGETKYTLRRVVEYCDGWFPRMNPDFDPAAEVARLKAAADEAGRDMADLSINVFRAPADKAALDRFAEAGITRAVLELRSDPRDEVMKTLDGYAELIA